MPDVIKCYHKKEVQTNDKVVNVHFMIEWCAQAHQKCFNVKNVIREYNTTIGMTIRSLTLFRKNASRKKIQECAHEILYHYA